MKLILTRISIKSLSKRSQAKLGSVEKDILNSYPAISQLSIRLYACSGFRGGKDAFTITYTIQQSNYTNTLTIRNSFTKNISQVNKGTILRSFRQQYTQLLRND